MLKKTTSPTAKGLLSALTYVAKPRIRESVRMRCFIVLFYAANTRPEHASVLLSP